MTWPTSTWCVVPCPASRLDELAVLVDTCGVPPERLVVVTAADHDPIRRTVGSPRWLRYATLIPVPGPRNIARWWNAGLDHVNGDGATWEVFLPGSDVLGETWSVAVLAVELRRRGLTMVGPHFACLCADWSAVEVYAAASRRTVFDRVPGACMMVAGESGLRFDERMPWWYSDDDAETWARHNGGAGLVHGTGLLHPNDHPLDAEQAEHATASRALYVQKWGREPW